MSTPFTQSAYSQIGGEYRERSAEEDSDYSNRG